MEKGINDDDILEHSNSTTSIRYGMVLRHGIFDIKVAIENEVGFASGGSCILGVLVFEALGNVFRELKGGKKNE